MESESDVLFTYTITTDDGRVRVFNFALDKESLFLKSESMPLQPAWAQLDNHKCVHCPLNSEETPYCPIAINLPPMVNTFKDLKSYTEVDAVVTSKERTYSKRTNLQTVIASMMGIVMATSGCPHMNFLRVMARFHLPFASLEETYIRTTSFFLLRQYLRMDKSESKNISLDDLQKNYDDIKNVNLGIVERIRSLGSGDADPNAITMLHTLADLVKTGMMNPKFVEDIHKLFTRDA